MKATNQQLQRIHTLLFQTNQQEQKPALVARFSNGRTESSRSLFFTEAHALILHLEDTQNYVNPICTRKQASANQMRRKLISIAHNMKWQNPNGTIDLARLNRWCLQHSYLKKELMKYRYNELPKLISQFQEVYLCFIGKNFNV